MERKLKIVMFGQKHLSREGGIEVVAMELATRMAAMGMDITCINRRAGHIAGEQYDSGSMDGRETCQGVKIRTVPTIERKGLAALTSSFFAAWHAALGDYDVVHIHAEGPAAFCWLPKLFGKRVVCQNHGLDYRRPKWGRFAKAFLQFGERMSARWPDELIVLNESIAQYFMDSYKRETKVIPNGITRPAAREADAIREKWGLEKDSYILSLGRLTEEKGLHYLIDAYCGIKTDKKLVIAGGSSDSREYVERLRAQAAGNPDIIFTGFVQGNELEELYSSAYLYVLPSDLEGMPMSLLEAMSYGNCCLVSDIPENLSVVGERAAAFQKGNIDDLKNQLQGLCENEPLVQGYKAQAADYICGKYNWDDIVREILKLYCGEED